MQPRSWCVTLSLACLLSVPAATFGAGGIVVPGNGKGGNNNNMAKGQELKDQILRFVASQEQAFYNKKRTVVLFTKVDGTHPIKAIVGGKDPGDPDPEIQTTVDHLTKGDVVKMNMATWNGVMAIDYIKKVEVKPAEDNPHGFIFQEFYNEQGSGAPVVRLTKYGESYEVTFPMVKGEKGKSEFDPALVDAVQKFKAGEALYVQLQPGRMPVATEMFPYKDPQTGKITKESEQEVDGGKTPAVDIEASDGKSVTALVPGKMNGKRFVPDPVLARTAHGLKPGTEVVYMTRDDNGKSYLVEIAKAPKSAAPKPGAADSMAGGNSKTAKAAQ